MGKRRKETVWDFLWFYRKWTVTLATVLTVACLLTACSLLIKGNAAGIQEGIAKEILRFHVVANSDSEEDQALKLAVRDAVLGQMERMLDGTEDLEETKRKIKQGLGKIRETACETVKEHGRADEISVCLTSGYFPRKSYGDCTFPAGQYEALKVCIGNAKGRNWWCVLFPNLCVLDSAHAVLPETQKEQLAHVLSEEEYESLFDWEKSEIKITSRILEWLGW